MAFDCQQAIRLEFDRVDTSCGEGAVMGVLRRPALRSEEIDANILDITAGLLAGRGIKDTAVQAVADAAGYSKSAVLKRFATKETLIDKAIAQCTELTRGALVSIQSLDAGASRDAEALLALVDLSLRRRGWVELLLAALPERPDDGLRDRLRPMGEFLAQMFELELVHDRKPRPHAKDIDAADFDRRARVTGAVGAVAILALTYRNLATPEQARPLILAACWNTLGHVGAYPGSSAA